MEINNYSIEQIKKCIRSNYDDKSSKHRLYGFIYRMLLEHEELEDKVSKLENFMGTNYFQSLEEIDKNLQITQLYCMKSYLSVLGQRIDRSINLNIEQLKDVKLLTNNIVGL